MQRTNVTAFFTVSSLRRRWRRSVPNVCLGVCLGALAVPAAAQIIEPSPSLDHHRRSRIRDYPVLDVNEGVLIREGYRMFSYLRMLGWEGIKEVLPTPILLLTNDSQYLIGHPAPPETYFLTTNKNRVFKYTYGVERELDCKGAETRPMYGAPTIVIASRTCTGQNATEWMYDYVRCAFRLFAYSQGELVRITRLNVPFPDPDGQWKRDYKFPYRDPKVIEAFNDLASSTIAIHYQQDPDKKRALLEEYVPKRKHLAAVLDSIPSEYSHDDFFRYLTWSEGLSNFAAFEAMSRIRHAKKTVREIGDWVSYTDYTRNTVRNEFSHLRREPVTDEITPHDIAMVGAVTAGIIDHYVPNWRSFVMDQDMWLEDLMAGARMEAQ